MKINKAKIKTVTYFNPENSYAVLKIIYNGKLFTAAGQATQLLNFSNIKKAEGSICNIEGEWIKHPQYGTQLQIKKLEIDNTGVEFFLINFVSGIGERLAKQLINHYGEEKLQK